MQPFVTDVSEIERGRRQVNQEERHQVGRDLKMGGGTQDRAQRSRVPAEGELACALAGRTLGVSKVFFISVNEDTHSCLRK